MRVLVAHERPWPWRSQIDNFFATMRLEAIASRLEAIATRLEASMAQHQAQLAFKVSGTFAAGVGVATCIWVALTNPYLEFEFRIAGVLDCQTLVFQWGAE